MDYVFITKNYPPTVCGIAYYTYNLAVELAKRGHNVSICTSAGQEPAGGRIAVSAPFKKLDARGFLKLFLFLRRLKPSIVNFQYIPQVSGTYGFSIIPPIFLLFLKIFTKHRVITTFHELFIGFGDNPVLWPVALLQRINCFLISLLSGDIVVTTNKRKEYFSGKLLRVRAHYIPVGNNVEKIALEASERLALRGTYALEDEILFSSFGTASRNKDYLFMIRTVSVLNELGMKAALVLIGDIERDYEVLRAVRKEVRDRGMAPKIFLTGTLPMREISKLLSSSDFFIANQKNGITTGSGAVAAAIAHGIPVIANQNPKNDPVYVDGANIFLVTMSDPSEAAAMIKKILSDERAIKKVREGTEKLYSAVLSWQSIGDRLLAING